MKYHPLGRTGILVSEICYGALPIGPLQANFSVEKAAEIIRYSLEHGINFIDTAQRYQTYEHIRKALFGYPHPVIIASKSGAVSYQEMSVAIDEARRSLKRDAIDIFHLHAARAGAAVFTERRAALNCLTDAKASGAIRAIGISTHSVAAVRAAAEIPEIDVVFPIANMLGLGILDGTLEDMLEAIQLVVDAGKGVYLMKAMAGGHLAERYEQALGFARNISGSAAVAVGMLSTAEVDANIAFLDGRTIEAAVRQKIAKNNKKLHVLASQCIGCGHCEEQCPSGAIKVMDSKAQVDSGKCILCGYCVPHCPQFCLRLINREQVV